MFSGCSLIAAIYGGSRTVSRAGNFTLNASYSVDGEMSPLSFEYNWAYAQVATGALTRSLPRGVSRASARLRSASSASATMRLHCSK